MKQNKSAMKSKLPANCQNFFDFFASFNEFPHEIFTLGRFDALLSKQQTWLEYFRPQLSSLGENSWNESIIKRM